MKANQTHGQKIRQTGILGVAVVFGVFIMGSGTVFAQCGPANCMGVTGAGKNCTIMSSQFCGMGGSFGTTVMAFSGINASCISAGPNTGSAIHTAGQSTPATCGFSFMKSCSSMTTNTSIPFTTTYPITTTCSITSVADGLPVELMGFEITGPAPGED